MGATLNLPAEYGPALSGLQEPSEILPKDRVLFMVREGKASNTLDGQAKRVAGVWCVGAHDDLVHTEVRGGPRNSDSLLRWTPQT